MNCTNRIYLLPGDIAFCQDGKTISTLLGSCVAVCLYDRRNKWGGMNHYMLANTNQQSHMESGKCGEYAIPKLLQMALRAGSKKTSLVASVFGGGKVVGHLGSSNVTGMSAIGDKNIEIAIEFLNKEGISIVGKDVGGTLGRKIHMNTATNEIEVRKIKPSEETKARAQKMERMEKEKVKVLVVDDSSLVRKIISRGINMTNDLEVVGEAANPYEARELILERDPDVLCLDIIMPKMDGLTFLRKVMAYKPIPTVIVSTIAKAGSAIESKAAQAGAVAVFDKEKLQIYKDTKVIQRDLLPMLRRAAMTIVRKRG